MTIWARDADHRHGQMGLSDDAPMTSGTMTASTRYPGPTKDQGSPQGLVHFDRNGFGYTLDRVTGTLVARNSTRR